MNSFDSIANTFSAARSAGRAALMPYYTLGYPHPNVSLDIVEAIAHSGADLIELGVPFSDPLADGPTIQHSTQVALEHGINAAQCLEMVAALRQRNISQPLFLMGYINPLLAYGAERFIIAAAQAGANGLILPDLPLEEADAVESACKENNLALVYLLPPTASVERARALVSHTSGFVYMVSLTGVTGARKSLSPDLKEFIQRVRPLTSLPLAVGFGISTPEQVQEVGTLADGVIVGSALINAITQGSDPVQAAAKFVASLSSRIDTPLPLTEK